MGNTDYETPSDFFRERWLIHHFTVDAAASDTNALVIPKTGICSPLTCNMAHGRYYTAETNGLLREHYVEGDRVWCNPPYDHGLYRWVKLALDCARDGILWELLLPANPGPRWFKDLLWNDRAGHWRDGVEAHYVGRIQFLLDGKPILGKHGKVQSSRQENLLVTLHPEAFAS